MNGTSNFINNTANDPGFVSLSLFDYHLLPTAQPVDKGQTLDANSALTNPLTMQYVYHQAREDRTIFGAAFDLGAFEYVSGTGGNTPPTISDVTNQSSTGSPVGPLAFSVGDTQTAAGSLVVTRSSSNTTLLPLANIVLGGSGANRTVSVTPIAGQTGTATVTLTVTDAGGLTATDTFTLTVSSLNTPPTISDVTNQTSTGSSVGPLAFTIGDAQTVAGSLIVTRSSSNTTLLPLANIVLGGTGANRTVTVTPAAGQTGTATVTLTVTDAGGLTATDTFTLTVSGSTLQFRKKVASVGEGAGTVTLYVTRTGSNIGALTLNYTTSNGTAAAPGDYTTKTGTLTWASGSSVTKKIVVPIINDALAEGDETFFVTLSNPTGGATLGARSKATVTILANDNGSRLIDLSASSPSELIEPLTSDDRSIAVADPKDFSTEVLRYGSPVYLAPPSSLNVENATIVSLPLSESVESTMLDVSVWNLGAEDLSQSYESAVVVPSTIVSPATLDDPNDLDAIFGLPDGVFVG
jgi:hypothetical protein